MAIDTELLATVVAAAHLLGQGIRPEPYGQLFSPEAAAAA